jgi:cell division septation protein DedD
MAREDANHLDDLNDDLPPREVTLSTSAILGLFFALALVCAAFFGFGYSVGRKSSAASTETNPNAAVPDTYKPTAGSPAIQPVPGYLSAQQAADANKSGSDSQVLAPPSSAAPATRSAPSAQTAANNSATPANQPAPVAARPAPAANTATAVVNTPAPPPPAPAAPAQSPAAVTNNYVQIAAVSRQDDADLLLKALRTRGYAVAAHAETDRLIHVQMGPFTTRKDAEAMRQRLLADGYNAIVK